MFNTDKTIEFEGETIILKHYGPGHTDTDVSLYFRNADILQVGDIWWNGHYPFLDNGAGGHDRRRDPLGSTNASRPTTDRTLIIPGHGGGEQSCGPH